eukprot:6305144-Ditylum_brightwellii.AAC.1
MERHSRHPFPHLDLLWAVLYFADLMVWGNVPFFGGDPNFLPGGPPDIGCVLLRWRSFNLRKRDGRAPGQY